jgi:hypothetical protein
MLKLARFVFVVAWCVWEGSAFGASTGKRKKGAAVSLVRRPEGDTVATAKGPPAVGDATVVGEIGPEIGIRRFRYNEALFGRLRDYSNNAIPMASVSAELYPFASGDTPVLRDIGLVGRFGTSLTFQSKTQEGNAVNGSWMRYAVGARARIPLNSNLDAVLLGIEATYGDSKFNFTGSDPVVLAVPSVNYKYIRGGADVRLPFGAWALLGGAGYLHVLSSGAYGDKFPHATVTGVDAHAGAALRVAQSLEARLGAEYTRVFSTANPQPGDANVAGGTLDQYIVLHLGLSAFF